ncbi:broad-complex core protein isoforms 1/2/3/4/5-like isoform X1 [Ochlerotatus camptorhynchus]|uniref:broad-complex core protein isoforms 1/2/3/4/5-like isoform X1 n=1 Tax=Ochlerotatus camptorhynchus TaxID=644619 RepID=UPI0031DDA1F6
MDEFALCWNNFADNIASGFQNLYDRGDLVDVTIACDGKLLKAHKIVLAICSPYFQEMFTSNPCKHPIIVLKDVSVNVMQELLQFMYQGEVNVKHSELQSFMKIAETLQIKGLTASHKNDRSPTPSAQPAPAHLNSNRASTSQLDPSKLNSYLAAAAKDSLKRVADGTSDQYPIHYPKKAIKRSTDSMEQDSNSECMDNLSSDEAYIPASPQVSMVEQSFSTARQFDLSNVKREATNDSLTSPQQSPTNLATSAAAMGAAAAAAAAGMKLGFSSTPTHPSATAAALHPMFGGFDHNSTSFSGLSTSLASMSGNGASGVGPGAASGEAGNSTSGMKMGSMDYPSDYGSDYGKGGILPIHMDIPAGSSITMLSSTSLLHNNCIFNRNNTVATQQGLKTYWLCKSYRVSMCRARCITHHGQVISSTGVHNHPPHMKGPHEFSHQSQPQPPPPPPPPPNLGPPQPIPQNHHHHPQDHLSNIPPALNNGTYPDFPHNSHYQPNPNVMMGPPPNHDPNQYPSHHHHHHPHPPQQPPYPEMPPHHHPYPTHYTNPPPNMPPQAPLLHQQPPPPQLPPQNTAALPEPEAPDIKLIQLQPAVLPSAATTAVDASTNSIAGVDNDGDNLPMQPPQAVAATTDAPDEANPQHLQLKIEQLS